MERTLLTVKPALDGWRVMLGQEALGRHDAKEAAIDLATRFARNRHEITGEPTGVLAPICNGEIVLLGCCG